MCSSDLITTAKRDEQLPDVPTLIELGIKNFEVTNWYGVAAPAGTPPEIVNKLNAEINRILQLKDVVARFDERAHRVLRVFIDPGHGPAHRVDDNQPELDLVLGLELFDRSDQRQALIDIEQLDGLREQPERRIGILQAVMQPPAFNTLSEAPDALTGDVEASNTLCL